MRKINKRTILLSALLASSLYAKGEYKAVIVDHAECKPKAKNDRPSGGMQKNRRVDVSIKTKQMISHDIVTKEQITRKAYLDDGGVVWVSSDPLKSDPKLEIKAQPLYLLSKDALKFYTYNNYKNFIKRYEIDIYDTTRANQKVLIKSIKGDDLSDEIEWRFQDEKFTLSPEGRYEYILKVFDKDGNYDETYAKRLIVKKSKKKGGFRDIEAEIFGKSSLRARSIPIRGARVRVYGSGISPDSILKIGDQEVRVDKSGKFVYEQIRESGHYTIPVSVLDPKGNMFEKDLSLDVDDNHIFMVGLADFTAGRYDVSGNIKPLEADEHFNEDIFIDGRLAFYLKGKIKGKYLVTAQLDTQENDIKDMFKNIQKKDPKTAFRHLDPDQYYYVYGDDSTSYKDTDSEGKLYLKVEWDKSKALWGNFNTGITGNEFANVNRTLYGAKFQHSSMGVTKYGDNKTDVTVFASEAQSAYAHNEFEGTGGSLYYLKHRDIVQGSAKVWVEVVERNSLRVAQKKELKLGRDYEIDEIQGRIILTRPLVPRSRLSGPSIIKDTPLDGNKVVLKVDYEYLPDNFKADQATYGARAKEWLTDYLAIGATYAHEGRSDSDYEVRGADLTLRGGKNSYIKVEFANSDAIQSDGANFRSLDGGLHFDKIDSNNTDASGNAYGVEAKISLSDFKDVKNDSIASIWYKKREKGFSNARLGSSKDVDDYGIEALSYLDHNATIKARATVLEQENSKETTASIEADKRFDDLTLGAEVRYVDQDRLGKGTLAGLKAKYQINSFFDVYIAGQYTLSNEGDYANNDLYTVGADYDMGRLSLNAEASTGDRGDSVQLGANYGVSENYSVYTNYILSTDSTEGDKNTLTLGQRARLSDALSIFSEHQFSHSDNMAGLGNSFGIDYAFSKYLLANITYNKTSYDDKNQRDRDAISTSLHYATKGITASTKLEYRKDKGTALNQEQYLTTNRLNYKLNPSWALLAKYNYSKTTDNLDSSKEATFTEAGIGFAYRPVDNSRLNLIGKYTYLYDLSSLDQELSSPDEKSHIVSLEGSYQISSKWTIGSKVAGKKYSMRAERDSGEWFESKIYLGALRLNYHLIKKWDILLEGHMISQEDDGDKRGFLAGIYRHLGSHIKFGVGYNFSDFSDDLTKSNDYKAKGWFVNLIGKY